MNVQNGLNPGLVICSVSAAEAERTAFVASTGGTAMAY